MINHRLIEPIRPTERNPIRVNDSGFEPDYCLKQIRSKFHRKDTIFFHVYEKKIKKFQKNVRVSKICPPYPYPKKLLTVNNFLEKQHLIWKIGYIFAALNKLVQHRNFFNMKDLIFKALKTKYKNLGFSEKAFERVADYLAKAVTDEANIETAIDGVEGILKIPDF